MSKPITLTITLEKRTAQLLTDTSMACFYTEQANRFEWLATTDTLHEDADDSAFTGTVFHWCATASDAILYRAYKQAAGIESALLWDMGMTEADDSAYVVLCREPF